MLNIIAGRSASAPGIDISSVVKVNGTKINPLHYRKNIAYVMQDDGLLATITPREALRFSATLRLENVTTLEIEDMVEQTIDSLGLIECADTFIGGALIKGISGGQRKRTSVGIEIITKPSIILLDGMLFYCMYSL